MAAVTRSADRRLLADATQDGPTTEDVRRLPNRTLGDTITPTRRPDHIADGDGWTEHGLDVRGERAGQ